MLPALPRFRDEEFNILRICERNGWTYAQWNALPEKERIDRLAYQHIRDEALDKMTEQFNKRIENNLSVDIGAYAEVMLQRIA